MSIKKCCENCSCHFPSIENCTKPSDMSFYCRNHNYDLCEFKEDAIREDERNKFITLLKSDLENYDRLADEYAEKKDIHELLKNNVVRKYIEITIELLESEK